MAIFQKPEHCLALSLRERLTEEIIFWQQKVLAGQGEVMDKAKRMIDRRRCQLNMLDRIKEHELLLKAPMSTT